MSDTEQQKQEFLARCANAFDAGLCTPERLRLLDKWIDAVMRFEGGQMAYFADFLEIESQRTNHFHRAHVLAGDDDGYALVKIAAILTHPCQACATDPKAWWTRAAFCPHRNESAPQTPPLPVSLSSMKNTQRITRDDLLEALARIEAEDAPFPDDDDESIPTLSDEEVDVKWREFQEMSNA